MSSSPSLRLDAHQHFWRYDAAAYPWIGRDMSALRRDFQPADLRPLLDAAGFDGCIAVHTKAAKAAGASKEEIAEALGVAVALNAGAAMVYSARALDALGE